MMHWAVQEQGVTLLHLLPRSEVLGEWALTDSARTYQGRDLYLFIDGGADLFMEYGFRQALAAEYHGHRNEVINLEIYEMADPGAACGVYSVRCGDDAIPMDIGQGASGHSYYIMFWKGNYYVSVSGSDSTPEVRKWLEVIARAIDRTLAGSEHLPSIHRLLSNENLLKWEYIRGSLGLSSVDVIDVRGLEGFSEGVAGTYKDHTIVYLRWSGSKEAARCFDDVGRTLKSDARFRNSTVRNGTLTAVEARGRVICLRQSESYIVLAVASGDSVARASCEEAARSIRE
jgi:hypothetical protein